MDLIDSEGDLTPDRVSAISGHSTVIFVSR